MINLIYNNQSYFNYSLEALISAGVPESEAKLAEHNCKIDFVRQQRNVLLSETDWTQMPDSSLTLEKQVEFKEYRQALRDITNNLDNPEEVTWPTKPTL